MAKTEKATYLGRNLNRGLRNRASSKAVPVGTVWLVTDIVGRAPDDVDYDYWGVPEDEVSLDVLE